MTCFWGCSMSKLQAPIKPCYYTKEPHESFNMHLLIFRLVVLHICFEHLGTVFGWFYHEISCTAPITTSLPIPFLLFYIPYPPIPMWVWSFSILPGLCVARVNNCGALIITSANFILASSNIIKKKQNKNMFLQYSKVKHQVWQGGNCHPKPTKHYSVFARGRGFPGKRDPRRS